MNNTGIMVACTLVMACADLANEYGVIAFGPALVIACVGAFFLGRALNRMGDKT